MGRIRVAYTAGEAIGPELFEFYRSLGINVKQLYGMTESSALICIQRDGEVRLDTVGTPLTDVEVRVGESGEVLYRSPGVFVGYYKNPEETAKTLRDGWLFTGDMAKQDDEGFIYLVDRKKDGIISGGENIYPAEIENVLADCPDIAEVAVVGRPDERWGEAVVAVVVPARGARLSREGVCALLDGRVARYKHPRDVVFTASLPRTALGKVRREELKRLARREPVAGPA
jgi:fatty-acyl-CoA synthase